MKISARVGASPRLYMKKFHKSQRDPNPYRWVNPGLEKGYPARRTDPGWLLQSCKYLLHIDRRRVDPLRRVEGNPGSCKGGPRVRFALFVEVPFTAPGLWPGLWYRGLIFLSSPLIFLSPTFSSDRNLCEGEYDSLCLILG